MDKEFPSHYDPNKVSAVYADLGGGVSEAIHGTLRRPPATRSRVLSGVEPLPRNEAVDRARTTVRGYSSDGVPKPEERGEASLPPLSAKEKDIAKEGIAAARAVLQEGRE